MIAQAELQPRQAVLDIGCGTGTLAVWIKQGHPEVDVVGLDPDPPALARAERKAKRAGVAVRFDRGFADALDYRDATFDRVFSSMMFHHLRSEERSKALAEVRRVLKPGGRLEFLDLAAGTHNFLGRMLARPAAHAILAKIGCLNGSGRQAYRRRAHRDAKHPLRPPRVLPGGVASIMTGAAIGSASPAGAGALKSVGPRLPGRRHEEPDLVAGPLHDAAAHRAGLPRRPGSGSPRRSASRARRCAPSRAPSSGRRTRPSLRCPPRSAIRRPATGPASACRSTHELHGDPLALQAPQQRRHLHLERRRILALDGAAAGGGCGVPPVTFGRPRGRHAAQSLERVAAARARRKRRRARRAGEAETQRQADRRPVRRGRSTVLPASGPSTNSMSICGGAGFHVDREHALVVRFGRLGAKPIAVDEQPRLRQRRAGHRRAVDLQARRNASRPRGRAAAARDATAPASSQSRSAARPRTARRPRRKPAARTAAAVILAASGR